MASNFGSDFGQKYRDFMAHRNGPDQLSRDCMIAALVLILLSLPFDGLLRSLLLTLGLVALVYSYFRLFSGNISARSTENQAYIAKRSEVLGKLGQVKAFQGIAAKLRGAGQKAQAQAAKAATRAADTEHKYHTCPKCHQEMRVPKGVGKIRVTCPKCGEKFEMKS